MRTTRLLMPTALILASVVTAAPPGAAPPVARQEKAPKVVLVIHGGAGTLSEKDMEAEGLKRAQFEKALESALAAGYRQLKQGKTSVDAVEAAVRVLEDSELFNAGRGAVFNSDGRVELDASIMEGNWVDRAQGEGKKDQRKRAGAVAGVAHVKNPISAARAVMEMEGGRHVMLTGEGAESFVFTEANRKKYGIERVSNLYFWTDRRLKQIRDTFAEETRRGPKPGAGAQRGIGARADARFATVGAVALDQEGNLAAGTSTGGLSNKLPGRVGDSPVIGAGTYADNRACGVSCTGTGEVFIRHAVAHDVVARMLYGKNVGIADAVAGTIKELPDEDGGVGGLIALDHKGRHAFGMSPNSDGMYRGYVTEKGDIHVAIYAKDRDKRMR